MANCQYCKEPIDGSDYTSIPAHVHCVTGFTDWTRKHIEARIRCTSCQVAFTKDRPRAPGVKSCVLCKSKIDSKSKNYGACAICRVSTVVIDVEVDDSVMKVCSPCRKKFDKRKKA